MSFRTLRAWPSKLARGRSTLALGAGLALFAALAGGETATSDFPPLAQWEDAVTHGGGEQLAAVYSTSPPARVKAPSGEGDAQSDVRFWSGLKARRLRANLVESRTPQPGLRVLLLQIEIESGGPTLYLNVEQIWLQQGTLWRLAEVQRNDPARLQQPLSTDKQIYPPGIDAGGEIGQAVKECANDGKRVLLVFGANWCYDCHVLDLAFGRADIAPVLKRNYRVVNVDVGNYDKNQDLAAEYQIPLKRGVPALAVLDSHGKLLYTQENGEFEKAHSLSPQQVLQFLNRWKPPTR